MHMQWNQWHVCWEYLPGWCLSVYGLDHKSTTGAGFGNGCEKTIRKGFYKYFGLKRTIKENTPSIKSKTGEITDMNAVQATIPPYQLLGAWGCPMNALSSPQGSQARCAGNFTAPILTPAQCRGKSTHCKLRFDSYSKAFPPTFQ